MMNEFGLEGLFETNPKGYFKKKRKDKNNGYDALANDLEKTGDGEDGQEDAEKAAAGTLSQLTEIGTVSTDNSRGRLFCLTIIGQIEGHYALPPTYKTTKYEHVIPQLVAIEESPEIDGLLILLNTVGGDVEAGLALAELIAGMKKPTVSLVLGGGHSIGAPLAVAAKRSFIAPTATMTLHPVRTNGLVLGVPQAFSYFERMQERITGFVAANSKIKAKRFTALCMNTGELVMDVGTVLDGEAAVAEGLIDSLGSLSDALESLYKLIDVKDKKPSSKSKTAKSKSRGKTETTVKSKNLKK